MFTIKSKFNSPEQGDANEEIEGFNQTQDTGVAVKKTNQRLLPIMVHPYKSV
jgi:hypothetical protein